MIPVSKIRCLGSVSQKGQLPMKTENRPNPRPLSALPELLSVPSGICSVIGSGGKSSLLLSLSLELAKRGRVILGTSTHILPFPHCPLVLFSSSGISVRPSAKARILKDSEKKAEVTEISSCLEAAFSLSPLPILCLGSMAESGKLSPPPIPWKDLLPYADYILIEADGSKRLPLKAHAPWEPVIPEGNARTIAVIGGSGLGHPIKEAVHRPELFLSILREKLSENPSGSEALTERSPVTEEMAALVLEREALFDKLLLNQTDSLSASSLSRFALAFRRPFIAASLRENYCFPMPLVADCQP